MKRIAIGLPAALLLLLAAFYFIPATRGREVFVASTFDNIISSLKGPRNWIKWDTDIRKAWLRDSSSCNFIKDTTNNTSTITSPGKKIRVTARTYLLYDVEQINSASTSRFVLSVIPYVGNGEPRSRHNSKIAYTEATNLLFKLFPFLDCTRFAERTIGDIRSYLEDNSRFYGFPIEIKTSTEILFIVKRDRVATGNLFVAISAVVKAVKQFAISNRCVPGNRNISFGKIKNDSVDVLVGVNVDKVVPGNDSFGFMQFPPGQIVLTGHFHGPFQKLADLYAAMEKYMFDHELVQNGAPYEKYISSLPVSENSIVKIDLYYPLRY